MLIPGSKINAFTSADACKQGSWFTGKMNTQKLDFDPLVTGYAFIIWTKIPFWVNASFPNFREFTQKNFKAFEGLSDIELQTGQYNHTFNANAYEYATTIQKGNTQFSIRHQEFSGNPVKNMYQFWVTGIRDPETDIAVYPRAFNCEYGAKNHTGELLYIVTRPDANNVTAHNIEFAAYYTAVMPLKVPIGHMSYTQGDHNSPEIDINFVGDLHIGPEVDDFAQQVMSGESSIDGFQIVTPYQFITSALFKPGASGETRGDGKYIQDNPDDSPYSGGDHGYRTAIATEKSMGDNQPIPAASTADGTTRTSMASNNM